MELFVITLTRLGGTCDNMKILCALLMVFGLTAIFAEHESAANDGASLSEIEKVDILCKAKKIAIKEGMHVERYNAEIIILDKTNVMVAFTPIKREGYYTFGGDAQVFFKMIKGKYRFSKIKMTQ